MNEYLWFLYGTKSMNETIFSDLVPLAFSQKLSYEVECLFGRSSRHIFLQRF
jgi:hypothetical protein